MSTNELLKKIIDLPVIDTHEHITAEKAAINDKTDIFDLFMPYVCDNLMTAGMDKSDWEKLLDKNIDIDTRWNMFEPYLEDIKYTTYYQAVLKVIRDLFNEKELNKESMYRINKCIVKNRANDYYKYYMDKCNIKEMLTYVDYTPEVIKFFEGDKLKPVPTVSLALPRFQGELERFEETLDVSINNLGDLEKAWIKLFKYYYDNNINAIKIGSAYNRKLDYTKVERKTANDIINKLINKEVDELTEDEAIIFDNYMIDYMVGLAEKYNMVVVIHVGIHAWNENYVERCYSRYLNNLFDRFKNVKFVILHSGIPFIDEAILLSKYYKNVYLNMTWMHIIDREKSKEAIKRYIEMLPISKIVVFGGDYAHIENVYGHYRVALENMCEVFGELINKELMTQDEALEISRKWLYTNAVELFRL